MTPSIPSLHDAAREDQRRRQHRKSSITSVVIAVLVMILVLIALGLVLLPSLSTDAPVVVAYQGPVRVEDPPEPKKVTRTRQAPSAPSAAMSRVITANATRDVAMPVVDFEVTEPSMEFGSGNDFGDGWGNGAGGGAGGGGTTFFEQKVKAERIAYVIDYSLSMRGRREKLMRHELGKSIGQLAPGTQFQVISFAGPAWVAGSRVTMNNGNSDAVVDAGGEQFKWRSGSKSGGWEPFGRRQRPQWISVAPGPVDEAKALVETMPLVWGTDWENPLEMAIAMEPPPQLIFFMTDGAVGGDMVKLARKLGNRAKHRGIIVNTVAMMEPKAEAAMMELAKRAGGQFTIVKAMGEVEVVPMQ
ncbi:hypothetical protein [Luteolibacter marinus]|uniref:hypothetical protein n=1 Tax=Luteolibacter marinus TaxID=2776705 RepID=UPI001867A85F|nr:hypothetical protein [Luteolibacter marinus]